MPNAVPARAELLALLAATRPDWRPTATEAVVAEAAQVGLTWAQAMVGLVRLAADPDGVPGDLVVYTRAGKPAPPKRQREHLDRIRAQLGIGADP